MFYDIDTAGKQSGAPVYFKYGDIVTLIGIHKGYSEDENLNYCTMITNEVMTILQDWIMKITGSLEEVNLKKTILINSE